MLFARLLSLGAIAVLGSGLTANAQTYDLKYKFSPDQELQYQSQTEVAQEQNVAGMAIETKIKTSETTARRFIEVTDDGLIQFEIENKKVSVEMSIAQLGEYKFSSDSNSNDTGSALGGALTPVYETMSGAILKLKMSPRGKIDSVDGLEELLKPVLKDNPLGQQFTAGASKAGAKMTYSEFFVEFPDKPLAAGDTWEVPYDIALPKLGEAKGKRKYTLVGPAEVDGRKALKIQVENELSIDINLDTNGITVSGTLAADDSTGEIHFDPALGQIVSLKNEVKISGNLTLNANGMEIPLTQSQTQTVTSKLVSPK